MARQPFAAPAKEASSFEPLKSYHPVTSSALDNETSSDQPSRRHSSVPTVQSDKDTVHDENVIARFGKKPQLKRRFKSLSSIGLICGMMLTWASVLFSLRYGLANGGPAGLIYGYLAAWMGAMFQAVVMAEMASMIPLTGGFFNWVAILAPDYCKKFLSYLAGWLTVIGWQAFVAAISYTCATTLQGTIILNYPGYEPRLWHATLMSYAVFLFGLLVNTWLGRHLPQIEAIMLILYVVGFFGVLIPVAYLAPHRSAAEAFSTFKNIGNWDSMGLAFFVGWYTSITSFLGGDSVDHIAEEIHQAQRTIPFSIWFSVLLNGVTGFAMLLVVVFSIDDVDAVINSATGYPIIDIFVRAMGSTSGGSTLMLTVTIINMFSISSVIATASRSLWAFSRERSLPFSDFLVKVNPETRLPINAILVTVVVNVLLALISIGSEAAYLALYSITLSAYYGSFIIAASIMLHKRLTTSPSEIPWGPFRLGRIGTPITTIAVCYSVLAMFWSFWPDSKQPGLSEMNYSCIIFGSALTFSFSFWFLHGRKVYTGPVWEFDTEMQVYA